MKKQALSICPNCKTLLDHKAVLYTRDLVPGSPIRESDVTGKSDLELHSYAASGVVIGKIDKEELENFFNRTTGLAAVEKTKKCPKCEYITYE